MGAVATKLTIEDFERLPQEEADYKELVDGELVDVSGNTPRHTLLRDQLIVLLQPFVRRRGLGLVLSEQEYRFGNDAHGPDVTFLCPAKNSALDMDKRVQLFVPDLAIEIQSPNDTIARLLRKARKYRSFGTAEDWVFFQKSQAHVFSETREVVLDDTAAFEPERIPGVSIPLKNLFDLDF